MAYAKNDNFGNIGKYTEITECFVDGAFAVSCPGSFSELFLDGGLICCYQHRPLNQYRNLVFFVLWVVLLPRLEMILDPQAVSPPLPRYGISVHPVPVVGSGSAPDWRTAHSRKR